MSEVSEALDDLHDGRRTLDEVADLFRTRDWPAREDPAQPVGGAFSEIAHAHATEVIDRHQYMVLAKAAADRINQQYSPQEDP